MRQFCFLLLLLPALALGQTDFDMDEIARNVPNSYTRSVPELANYFSGKIKDDRGRVRAIFSWITLNVKYVDRSNKTEIWATPEHLDLQRPEQVLLNRSAVCQGYANLFQALCSAVGIESQVVTGIAKNESREVMRIGHAWVAAQIQGKWQLFDPTWCVAKPGEGWAVREKYFMMPPEKFVLDHLPDDPAWQLLEYPLQEADFRENEDEGIVLLLRRKEGPAFAFRDTLQQWISMDTMTRSFSSESRILQFNGNNQRILFGLGQQYWGLFFDLKAQLDSMCNRSIVQDAILLDTVYASEQIKLMRQYHDRARELFSQITEAERLEQTRKFYTPDDVQAITAKIEGSMWTAVFENTFSLTKKELNERNLRNLRRFSDAADKAYQDAYRSIDCVKLPNSCFAIWHNRSLVHIQLAERYSLFSKNLISLNDAESHIPAIEMALKNAKSLYALALEECEQLKKMPPPYEFVQDRFFSAEQGLFTLKVRSLSARRVAISSKITANASTPSKNRTEKETLKAILEDLAVVVDQVEDAAGKFGVEFMEVNLYNLHNESYTSGFNLSRLCYIEAVDQYNNAIDAKTVKAEKSSIEAKAQEALRWLQVANQSLDYLEKSGRATGRALEQRAGQVSTLAKAIREVLGAL